MAIPRAVRPRLELLGVFCVAALYFYVFVRVLWRVGDEGTILYGAALVRDGAVPYRDFFGPMGPVSFYWLALWFRLFGTSWVVSRAVLLLTGASTVCLVFWITRQTYGRYAAALSASLCAILTIPIWPGSNHHWDANLFFLAALAVTVMWQRERRTAWLMAAGAAAGVTAGIMIQKGLLAFAAVLTAVALANATMRRSWRDLVVSTLSVSLGFLGVVTAVVAWFFVAGAFPDLVYATVVFPLTRYGFVNKMPYAYGLREWMWQDWMTLLSRILHRPSALIVSGVFSVPFVLLTVLPLLALAVIVAGVLRRSAAFGPMRVTLWIGGAALWVSEAHRWDIVHLSYGSTILLAGVIGEALLARDRRSRSWREWIVLVVVFCAAGLGLWNVAVASGAATVQKTRRGDVRTFRVDEALQFLTAETQSGEWVFVYPYYPTYYFLAGVRNPTRYSILVYGYNTADQYRDAIASLEQRKPRFVLWDTVVDGDHLTTWFPSYVQPPARDLVVEAYLTEHYEPIGTKNAFRVLRRKTGL
jgi:4-amino-4-deoxy-L-arabinose transferase-like glycosyltransferase